MALVIAAALLTAMAMEGWSALLHRRLWHGPWWVTHISHHPEAERRNGGAASGHARLEFNDIFALAHALIATALMMWGLHRYGTWPRQLALGVSIGMTAFGLAYAWVHDGMVHGRLPAGPLKRSRYLRRVAAAHRVHHATHGPPFGLFLGPWVLRRMAAARRTHAATQLEHCRRDP